MIEDGLPIAEEDTKNDNTGKEENEKEACDPIREQVEKELGYSDDLIYGDLFRFLDFDKK